MTAALPLVEVDGLSVRFGPPGTQPAVHDLSFTVAPGEILALVGESGSGKSVCARSLVGLPGAGAALSARRLAFAGDDLLELSEPGWRRFRGRRIGFVLQDALVSLDPLRPVGREIAEALAAHPPADDARSTRASRHAAVLALLERAGIPDPASRAAQRPGELSGGLRQRALIASALAHDPPLLIADEPTTALDATVAAHVLDLLAVLRDRGTAILLISHDLPAVSRIADRVLVMRAGVSVEQGPVFAVLRTPAHPYTRDLIAAIPRAIRVPAAPLPAAAQTPDPVPLLEASGLRKTYPLPDGGVRLALHEVGFTLHPGRTLGLVGESGSGKSTAARIVLGLSAPDAGTVRFEGSPWNGAGPDAVPERVRRSRRSAMALIPQDPLGSFDPRWTTARILRDALDAVPAPSDRSPAGRDNRIAALLDAVRLPAATAVRRPAELSGGQRQRVAIARALAGNPKLLVCDEPVSALDVSVQARILDLLDRLGRERGLACLFISHDLAVIRRMSDDIAVMQDGRIIEAGPADTVLSRPAHPFTRALLRSAASALAA